MPIHIIPHQHVIARSACEDIISQFSIEKIVPIAPIQGVLERPHRKVRLNSCMVPITTKNVVSHSTAEHILSIPAIQLIVTFPAVQYVIPSIESNGSAAKLSAEQYVVSRPALQPIIPTVAIEMIIAGFSEESVIPFLPVNLIHDIGPDDFLTVGGTVKEKSARCHQLGIGQRFPCNKCVNRMGSQHIQWIEISNVDFVLTILQYHSIAAGRYQKI